MRLSHVSQPTSAWRRVLSTEYKTALPQEYNQVMKRLDYILCDLGIISRCSAVLQWSCNANKEILTVRYSSKVTWSFMSSDTTRTMPLCSPLKYLHRKNFVVVYSVEQQISFPLTLSEKLVPVFPSSLHISCHFQGKVLRWSTVACHQHHLRFHT